jgi:hypothetical protein
LAAYLRRKGAILEPLILLTTAIGLYVVLLRLAKLRPRAIGCAVLAQGGMLLLGLPVSGQMALLAVLTSGVCHYAIWVVRNLAVRWSIVAATHAILFVLLAGISRNLGLVGVTALALMSGAFWLAKAAGEPQDPPVVDGPTDDHTPSY